MKVYVVSTYWSYQEYEEPIGVFTSEQAAIMACLELEAQAEEQDLEIDVYYSEVPLNDYSIRIGKEVE